jgi:hypothetical protein
LLIKKLNTKEAANGFSIMLDNIEADVRWEGSSLHTLVGRNTFKNPPFLVRSCHFCGISDIKLI